MLLSREGARDAAHEDAGFASVRACDHPGHISCQPVQLLEFSLTEKGSRQNELLRPDHRMPKELRNCQRYGELCQPMNRSDSDSTAQLTRLLAITRAHLFRLLLSELPSVCTQNIVIVCLLNGLRDWARGPSSLSFASSLSCHFSSSECRLSCHAGQPRFLQT